jgi:diaminohydroxyphosphoribosylaminopyrimidine deaminase/5-amino-6-(5-phosphoribosylamino)uracil reductase
MRFALQASMGVRRIAPPNPWVGCRIVSERGEVVATGVTEAPGGRHAEIVALDEAGELGRGATMYTTLEPCAHRGRTPPCADRLVTAGLSRVVISLLDPDLRVCGAGAAHLAAAGIEVEIGVLAEEAEQVLRAYLTHRRSGRPYVVLKLAASLDGRIAAADGTSKWITGDVARADAQELRADSDAVLVGAGTVRMDDPRLTVRPAGSAAGHSRPRQPLRVVLGRAPKEARAKPSLDISGDPRGVLDYLGRRGVLQLLVEGGAHVAAQFHRLSLVDLYVVYLAPCIMGGDDGVAMFAGPGAPSIAAAVRGTFTAVRRLGADVRLDYVAGVG